MSSSSEAVRTPAGQVSTEDVKINTDKAARSVRKASYWFFGIAAFSLINTVLLRQGFNFSLGLSLNQFVGDVVVQSTGEANYITDSIAAVIFIVLCIFAIRIQR